MATLKQLCESIEGAVEGLAEGTDWPNKGNADPATYVALIKTCLEQIREHEGVLASMLGRVKWQLRDDSIILLEDIDYAMRCVHEKK